MTRSMLAPNSYFAYTSSNVSIIQASHYWIYDDHNLYKHIYKNNEIYMRARNSELHVRSSE